MSRREITKLIGKYDSWLGPDVDPRARTAFVKQMRGRQYGYEPLLSAWLWFVAGWNAK